MEVRVYWQGELMCPNPVEHYKNTRTYEQMRFEYDLLHAGELDEIDLMRLASIKRNIWAPYIVLWAVEAIALTFFAWVILR